MGHVGSLKHLSDEDKKDILFEISFFFSQKGFIDGVALYERFEKLLQYQGEIDHEMKRHYKDARKPIKRY